jgi:hypothetical protein
MSDLTKPLPANMLLPNPETIGMQDLSRLLTAHLKRAERTLNRSASRAVGQVLSSFSFTELDQAFVGWGAIALTIFSLAQFSALTWTSQAVIDAALTGIGIAGTSRLTWQIAAIARLRWVVCLWAVLMMAGVVTTTCGIFGGVVPILANLCPLWLGLCAMGYAAMAVGLRSRCFSVAGLVHSLAIFALCAYPRWQFLISGLVMALTLFFFSVVPWDIQTDDELDPEGAAVSQA